MTSQNSTENRAMLDTTPPTAVAPKDEKLDQPSEIKRELTEEELASIAGGPIYMQYNALSSPRST